MSDREYVRLGLRIMDEQLVDCDGRRCGRVEDLELEGEPGQPTRVSAILCGATAWKRRLPPAFAQLLPGDPRGLRRVEWDHVAEIGNEIVLHLSEAELSRADGDAKAPIAVSQLVGQTVFDDRGDPVGRVSDVLASRATEGDANRSLEIEGVLVGKQGLLQRAGFRAMLSDEIQAGRVPDNLLPWRAFQL